jgi:AraC-type DNA-binding domain-containing proteins
MLRNIARTRPLPPVPSIGSGDSFGLGPLVISRTQTSASGFVRDAALIEASEYRAHVLVLLLLRGSLRGTSGDHFLDLRRGDIAFLDLDHAAGVHASEGTHVSLLVPRALLQGRVHGMVLRESQLPCRMLTRHLEQLVLSLPATDPERVDALVQSAVAVLQLCLDFAPAPASRPAVDPLRASILEYIDANLENADLNPEMIGQRFHISRTWLYRVFAGNGGIKRCIREKRLDAAFRDLCNDPQQRIIDVAYHRGFSSERQFQRAFLTRFGMTPSAVRDRRKHGLSIGL